MLTAAYLSAGNILSAIAGIAATVFIARACNIEDVGYYGAVVSTSNVLAIVFACRPDLLFARIGLRERLAFTRCFFLLSLTATAFIAVVYSVVFTAAPRGMTVYLAALDLAGLTILISVNTVTLALQVQNGQVGNAVISIVARSLGIIPLWYVSLMLLPPRLALIVGSGLAQLLAASVSYFTTVRSGEKLTCSALQTVFEHRALIISNVLSGVISASSVQGLAAAVIFAFSAAAAGTYWLIVRLCLTPVYLVLDPLRRTIYMRHQHSISVGKATFRAYVIYTFAVLGSGLLGAALAVAMGDRIMAALLREPILSGQLLSLAALWSAATLAGAPATALIPTLGLYYAHAGIELCVLGARVGIVLLGLFGFSFNFVMGVLCLFGFLWNLIWTAYLYSRVKRSLVPRADSIHTVSQS